jgi:hypothetical protein
LSDQGARPRARAPLSLIPTFMHSLARARVVARDHEHEDDDGPEPFVHYAGTTASADVLKVLDEAFPALSELLSLNAKHPELTDAEKADVQELSGKVEKEGPFTIGFHGDEDVCAVCEKPTEALFEDAFEEGPSLKWAAFELDLPVHPACAARLPEKFPRPVPRVIDQARRKLVKDGSRPPAHVAAFFRSDLLAQGAFNLEDWAENVHETNMDTIDRRTVKGLEKCIQYVFSNVVEEGHHDHDHDDHDHDA